MAGLKKKGKKRRPLPPGEEPPDVSAGHGQPSRPATGGAAAKRGPKPKVWRPGVDALADDEELSFDPSAYHCLHSFGFVWPCLSFDIVRDALGEKRTEFPHSVLCVAGTQADKAQSNTVAVLRLSNLTKMKASHSSRGEDDMEESESDSDSDSSDDDGTGGSGRDANDDASTLPPTMQAQLVAHHGSINRVRCMPQQPHIAATWGDTGHVQVWDLKKQIDALPGSAPVAAGVPGLQRQAPLFLFRGHKDEGFALDWSPVQAGQLLTGDCKADIYLWKPTPAGKWEVDSKPFAGHTASVEDIQWSPTEGDVFASCSVDKSIAIWDARSPAAPALSVQAHEADVNVISWNRLASCMLASGCDDGTFRIWDLRSFKDDSFIAHFKYHRRPITSIEWSAHESSTLAASCADNQTTIWDLSLERDVEEEAEFQAGQEGEQAEAPQDLPPQLLFVHQGQKDVKEVHWHPQVPGLLISTAFEGLNVFRPSNL